VSATAAVTALCALAVGWAVIIVVGARDQVAPVLPGSPPGASVGRRLREGLRVSTAVASAGFVGGLLGFGLGGRLMMRVLAATSPDAQGLLTDAEERVGEVSLSGTIFLSVFLALFSTATAGIYWLMRRWLPRRSILAGLVAGGVGGGLLIRVSGLLNPANRDFAILEPRWLAAMLCVAVVVLGSVTIAVLVDRWTPLWPMPARSVRGVAGLVPLVVFALPAAAGVGLIIVLVEMGTSTGSRRQRRTRGASPARWVFTGAGALGLAWIGFSAVEIVR